MDDDDLFGSPPSSPRLALPGTSAGNSTAALLNVGTIALPGSQLSEHPIAPPQHFLRNQQNLLGKAGIVARIHPSRLKHHHEKGKSPANPIVIDDDNENNDAPRIGLNPTPHIIPDPANLKRPSNHDIAHVLVGQRDIFPVLHSILKLLSDTSPLPRGPTGFERKDPSRPVRKKRKLNRVPAGAVDWDVPFPFEHGEGPEQYRATWRRERGRQLILQLTSLIKDAAKKAAVKNYLKEKNDNRPRSAATSTTISSYSSGLSTPRTNSPAMDMDAAVDPLRTQQDQALFESWMKFMQSLPLSLDPVSDFGSSSSGSHNTTIPTSAIIPTSAAAAAATDAMPTHSWAHLACHATQDTRDPLKSGLHLHDGRLGLLAVMKHRQNQDQNQNQDQYRYQYWGGGQEEEQSAEHVFLSACQTGTGDERVVEEAVHLAAGMLAVGYRGVVATMWSIRDDYGPRVAERFYDEVLERSRRGVGAGESKEAGKEKEKEEEGTRLDSRCAARALDAAMRALWEDVGCEESELLAWVPYVHFGV